MPPLIRFPSSSLSLSIFFHVVFAYIRERKKRNTNEKREGKDERKWKGGEEYVGASMSRRERDIVVAKEGWKFWAVARWRIALYKLAPRVSNLCYQTTPKFSPPLSLSLSFARSCTIVCVYTHTHAHTCSFLVPCISVTQEVARGLSGFPKIRTTNGDSKP